MSDNLDEQTFMRCIEEKVDDFLISHGLHMQTERHKWGSTEMQSIPVSDDTLLSIILPVWREDIFEMGYPIDWPTELAKVTHDNRFVNFGVEYIKPYRIRAGILLQRTPEYKMREDEKDKSGKYPRTGREVAAVLTRILDLAK